MKPTPAGPALASLVTIEKPVYGGACLAHVEGKAVFVPMTLPGEQARIRVTSSRSGYSTAEAIEIENSSPQRVAPACPHFGVCGGCHYQHAGYETQLGFKSAILRETLERAGIAAPAELGVLSAESWGYRNRIRLAFDAAGNPGYRGSRSHSVIPIAECPIAAPLLIQAALAFASVARQVAPALKPAEIALFTDPSESSLLLTVVVSSARKVRFDDLMQALCLHIPQLKGAELVLESPAGQLPRTVAQWGAKSLLYRAARFDYRVDHGAFFQVNRWLVDALVERVVADSSGKLAWDLYAGVGLFARQLTTRFDRVVAVEAAPASTQALAANLKGTRGAPVRSSTLDFLRRPHDTRPDLIVVDPPRTGLETETCALLLKIAAPSLAYVSCDPATLARDLRALTATGYSIHSIAVADLFPQTFHLETVVHLRHA